MNIVIVNLDQEERLMEPLCNRCGRSCLVSLTGSDLRHEISCRLEAFWPYGSTKDTEHHTSRLCEACYDWLAAQFKIPPAVREYFPGVEGP